MQILLVSHGDFATGAVNALNMIVGEIPHVNAITLKEGEDPLLFGDRLKKYFDSYNTDEAFLVFVDFVGGTPSNEVFKLIKNYKLYVIAGFNFPMILESAIKVMYDDAYIVDIDEIIHNGREESINLNLKYKEVFG